MKKKIAKAMFSAAKSPLGDLIVGITFGKLSKLLPVNRVYENKYVIAFWHPKPFWEKHIVIVPKKQIRSLTKLKDDDSKYIAEVFLAIKKIVRDLGWDKREYTLVMNGGKRQEIGQIHFHLQSGKVKK